MRLYLTKAGFAVEEASTGAEALAVLQRGGPAGAPIWVRFPEPVPLTVRLVEDLYWHCGTGAYHIELLTGQPTQTILGFMHRHGIQVRHPGGRSPFIQRWRARNRSS